MPKEQINFSTPTREPYEVQVGWSTDREVQVGVETYDGKSLLWTLFGSDENLEAVGASLMELARHLPSGATDVPKVERQRDLGRDALNIIESGGQGSYFVSEHGTAFYTGVWTILTRDECNRMIKVLRRARDSAYGRDE